MLSHAILVALTIGLACAQCPSVVSRSQWGARAPTGTTHLNTPVHYAFIHHATGSNCNSQSSCAALVRSYQNYHMDSHGWNDIGYTFVIGGDGSVFEGRGWDTLGAHTGGYNSQGHGFCLTGEFMTSLPPTVQMNAVKSMIACGVSLGKLESGYTLRGHRDMGATACPGDRLYAEIQTWPHY